MLCGKHQALKLNPLVECPWCHADAVAEHAAELAASLAMHKQALALLGVYEGGKEYPVTTEGPELSPSPKREAHVVAEELRELRAFKASECGEDFR